MLTDETKKQIEYLSTDELLYEINLGSKSRFQREKFAYLQICYQKKIEQQELINKLNSTNLDDVKQNLRQFRYQNHEVPIVRDWIQKQELILRQQPEKKPVPKSTDGKTVKTKSTKKSSLYRIAEGVIIGVLVLFIGWIFYHYFGITL